MAATTMEPRSIRVAGPRAAYVHFTELTTRWMDNGACGHIDNVGVRTSRARYQLTGP